MKEEGIKREDIFVTSKLWNTFHRPELVAKGLESTLNVSWKFFFFFLKKKKNIKKKKKNFKKKKKKKKNYLLYKKL